MSKYLVTYATLAGSTVEIAKAVAEELTSTGAQVDILPLAEVGGVDNYEGVVVGAPMIAGWHRSALAFLSRNRKSWRRVPLAVFVTAMSLTQTTVKELGGTPVSIDEKLPKTPVRPEAPNFRERYARVENYARPILSAARPAKPVSMAFFGGRLVYGRLPWWAVIFAMLIIQAPAGDKINWPFIHQWAYRLPATFAIAAESRKQVAK